MGRCANLRDLAVPDNVSLDKFEFYNGKNDLERVQEWVEKYNGINGRFRFFQAYMPLSPLGQTTGKPLISMKASGLIDVESAAKPSKHLILQKDFNLLSGAKGVKLFRYQENPKHLHTACEVLKSKFYNGVVSHDPAHELLISCDRWIL